MMGRPVGPQRIPTFTRGRVVVPRGPSVHGPTRVVPGPGRHFYVYPRSHAYFGFYAPWPYPFFWPPYYGLYVYPWSAGYYPQQPSADVLRLGLPEGVVKPGGQISGFVYFQNAAAQATSLQLVWNARTPDGKEVGKLGIPFVVVQ